MAITFPASPSNGDVFTNSTTGVKYIYNATDGVWKTHIWPTNTDYLQLSGGTLTGNLSLGTNDLTAQDITTTGSVTVGNGLTVSDGNLVMAAGHGIDFSADANAAGMTSELLNDYEEGTWTPSIGGNATYTIQQGSYIKVGKMVMITFYLTIDALGTGFSRIITGLPFNSSANTGGGPLAFYANLNQNFNYLSAYIYNSSSLTFYGNAVPDNNMSSGVSVFRNNATVQGALVYRAA